MYLVLLTVRLMEIDFLRGAGSRGPSLTRALVSSRGSIVYRNAICGVRGGSRSATVCLGSTIISYASRGDGGRVVGRGGVLMAVGGGGSNGGGEVGVKRGLGI